MGVDFLDLIHRVDRELGIQLDWSETGRIIERRVVPEGDHPIHDIQVGEFVSWVAAMVARQNPAFQRDVFEVVRTQIVECLQVEESEVTLEAWLVRDLGMA